MISPIPAMEMEFAIKMMEFADATFHGMERVAKSIIYAMKNMVAAAMADPAIMLLAPVTAQGILALQALRVRRNGTAASMAANMAEHAPSPS